MYYKNEKELNMCLTNDALFKGTVMLAIYQPYYH